MDNYVLTFLVIVISTPLLLALGIYSPELFENIIGICSVATLIGTIYYICAYSFNFSLSNIIIKKLIRRTSLTETDFAKTKDYFRDILYKYSVIELNYVDDFQINLKKEIIATLLNLELKGKIKLNYNEIEIISNNDDNLKLTEKDVFNSIKDGKVIISKKFADVLRKNAIEEAINDKLLIKMTKKEKIINGIIIFTPIVLIELILIILYNISYLILDRFQVSTTVFYFLSVFPMIDLFLITGILGISIATFIQYMKENKNMYNRTEEGSNINKKIEGLKKYIKDYSLLDEKEKELLRIWDEYLIYSVLFSQNKEILNKFSELIQFNDIPVKKMKIRLIDIILPTIIWIVFAIIALLGLFENETVIGAISLIILIIILKNQDKE